MDIFNHDFWQTIKKNIEAFNLNFTLNLVGKDFLSESERDVIRDYFGKEGLEKKEIPLLDKIYIFGKLAQRLKGQANNLHYKDFIDSLDNVKFPDQNVKIEKEDLIELKKQAYLDMLSKQFFIERSLRQEIIIREQERKAKKIKLDLDYAKKLAKIVTNKFEEWTSNIDASIDYISQSTFNQGRISSILEQSEEEDPLVYFIVHPDACPICKRVYLSNEIPIVFKLSTLKANGTNIGRKAKDCKATIFSVHPHCRCLLEYLQKGYVWNSDYKKYLPKEIDESKKVERKSKVLIYIGDKKFEV